MVIGSKNRRANGAVGAIEPVPPMEALLVDDLPDEPGWQFEPKWDGFRCLAFRRGQEVALYAKSGKPLARYFPEIVDGLRGLASEPFILDGELAVPDGDSLSFDSLQARLHPADSRVRRLARETPAIFILFDMLMAPDGKSLMDAPLTGRRAALESFFSHARSDMLRLSAQTRDRAAASDWLRHSGGTLDGVIAKRLDGAYESGERAMLKVKNIRTADCVVGGFRYGKDGDLAGSLLLGLFDEEGKLDHVGYTSGFASIDRRALTRQLEALRGPPGFTGRSPGGPSRWTTERSSQWEPLRHELVAEVRYDQVTGGRFRHGTGFVRWRPDKAPRQCTFDQLARPARPGKLVETVIGGR